MIGFRLQLPKVPLETVLDLERTLERTQHQLYQLRYSLEVFWREGDSRRIFEDACEELKGEGIEASLVIISNDANSQYKLSKLGEPSEQNNRSNGNHSNQSGWCIQLDSEDISDPIFGEIISRQIKLIKSLTQSRWSHLSRDYESLQRKLDHTTELLMNLSSFNSLVEFSTSREKCKVYLYYDQKIHETELDALTEKCFPLRISSKSLSYFNRSYLSKSTAHNSFEKDHPGLNVFLTANPSKALSADKLLHYTLNKLMVLYKGGTL